MFNCKTVVPAGQAGKGREQMEEQAFPPDGIQVKLEVWRGMFHVFQSHEPLLPEAREWRVTVVD